MNRIFYHFIFILIALAAGGCRKPAAVELQSVFVKLFPTDTSYQTGGCFQLHDGSYIIYGFDPSNSGINPLIIKCDENGNFITQKELSSDFHLLTIKLLTDGKMLAVGVGLNDASENVCTIDPDSLVPTFLGKYLIGSSLAAVECLPDFVEEDSGFTISGYRSTTSYAIPFILKIDRSGDSVAYEEYGSLLDRTNFRSVGIARQGKGYSIVGQAFGQDENFRGMFCLGVNAQLDQVYAECITLMRMTEFFSLIRLIRLVT